MPERIVLDEIKRYLSELESVHGVEVLYAVESGSRAWGFPSPDSDFDIRFVYVHPASWYLSVQSRRDVLEAMVPPDLDFAGWDLRKALPLLRKSNPSMLEWLGSPIVYHQNDRFTRDFRELAARCLSLQACQKHYISMARANWATYFKNDLVSLKNYLYVLRPVAACRLIELHRSMPPVVFSDLIHGSALPDPVLAELTQLLAAKSETSELGLGPRRVVLDNFIEAQLDRLANLEAEVAKPVPYDDLDEFFRTWVL